MVKYTLNPSYENVRKGWRMDSKNGTLLFEEDEYVTALEVSYDIGHSAVTPCLLCELDGKTVAVPYDNEKNIQL